MEESASADSGAPPSPAGAREASLRTRAVVWQVLALIAAWSSSGFPLLSLRGDRAAMWGSVALSALVVIALLPPRLARGRLHGLVHVVRRAVGSDAIVARRPGRRDRGGRRAAAAGGRATARALAAAGASSRRPDRVRKGEHRAEQCQRGDRVREARAAPSLGRGQQDFETPLERSPSAQERRLRAPTR